MKNKFSVIDKLYKPLPFVLILSVFSVLAGVLNGFIGSGGGVIIIYTLTFFAYINNKQAEKTGDLEETPKLSVPYIGDVSLDTKDIFASCVCSILPMSVVSAVVYLSKGSFNFKDILIYIPSALAGGYAGAKLLDRLKSNLVRRVFCVILIVAGIITLSR